MAGSMLTMLTGHLQSRHRRRHPRAQGWNQLTFTGHCPTYCGGRLRFPWTSCENATNFIELLSSEIYKMNQNEMCAYHVMLWAKVIYKEDPTVCFKYRNGILKVADETWIQHSESILTSWLKTDVTCVMSPTVCRIHQCAGTRGASQSGRRSEILNSFTILGDTRCKSLPKFEWYVFWNHSWKPSWHRKDVVYLDVDVGGSIWWTMKVDGWKMLLQKAHQLITVPGAYIQPLATITAGQGFEGCMGVEAQWQEFCLQKCQSFHEFLQIWGGSTWTCPNRSAGKIGS